MQFSRLTALSALPFWKVIPSNVTLAPELMANNRFVFRPSSAQPPPGQVKVNALAQRDLIIKENCAGAERNG